MTAPAWNNGNLLRVDTFGGRGLARPMLWMTALTVVAFLIWAANAPLEETTRGQGKVVPLSRGQIIQSLEGGILESLAVHEGEEVEANQMLAVIDDTRFRAAYQDLNGQTVALKASLSRLRAELEGADEIIFDPEVANERDVVQAERENFEARRRRIVEAVASFEERLSLARQELDLIKPMVKRGAVATVKQIELERAVADLNGELNETRNSYYQDINDQIAKKSAELASLTQQSEEKRDALTRTVLRSPVRGIVKNLEVTTRGGVIGPGDKIMEIVPLDDQLYVEAKIRPQDVAFLHTGQPATVKITAYDYTIYGMLTGKLVFISADTIMDESRQGKDAEPYYRVRVLTDSAALEGPEGPLPIKPGMVAEVNIQTGEKTVLEYLLKPILKGQEAFHER
ncbi:HlyD family type I secretion periplasmic adaptor subunit [Ciceribacter sp. RN22]|uniref:HlyD family type I secretion periplasmic adaptor subunit n=1 Tax=Ciceribacter sp. RN22 TaxID=2954932 RepID=UPI002092DE67|nr:HlyD family type I secretion periplasmic adaptor subunit [Ciceribacter sp. RN22]MCO6177491.1 HlyD family type I secretion periplasmic adaptor subunit [Ciceribacter sp. RN22]